MTSMKKLLLVGACAGLLALGAAPAMAAGPMLSTAKGDAVHKVEYRSNHWQGHRTWHQPPGRHYYGHYRPPYGHAYGYRYGRHYWSGRSQWYGRGSWRDHRAYQYRHHNNRGYWNQRIH